MKAGKKTPWLRIPAALLLRDDLSSTSKLVYAYMLWKYQFFKSSKKDYFESQTAIGLHLDISRWTVNQCIAELNKLGLLTSKRKAGNTAGSTCIYTLPDIYGMYDAPPESGNYAPGIYDEDY